MDLRTLMDLAESYRMAGQNREALAIFEQASARLTALGRDDTQTAGTLLNNWGVALIGLGRPLEAERVLRRAMEISSSGPNERSVSPMLLRNYAMRCMTSTVSTMRQNMQNALMQEPSRLATSR